MMAKHAYLILAHSDISLLEVLIHCLDDSRNDIYVHWDAKSGPVPSLRTQFSRLFFLEDRVEVNWAGYNMVEAEYRLFKNAFANGPYGYYHLLSGADLPIKPQDYIHEECKRMAGTEFIAFANPPQSEIDFRVQHYFLFQEEFKTAGIIKKVIRKLYLKYQDLTNKKRTEVAVRKGSQWCSLTHSFVKYLIEKESFVKETFSNTFCPDEMFIQTVCANSPFIQNVKEASTEFEGNMRFIKWVDGELLPIDTTDIPEIKTSDRWFARKFSSADKELIEQIAQLCK